MNRTLTHWGRVTRICVGNLTTIGPDNGLSPGRRQAIIWTNAVILLIEPLGTNFSEILIEMHTFSIKKMHLKMSSAKWCPFCLGLNVLNATMEQFLICTAVYLNTLYIRFARNADKYLNHYKIRMHGNIYEQLKAVRIPCVLKMDN